MTVLFPYEGWETNDMSRWDGVLVSHATFAASTDFAHHGTHSAKYVGLDLDDYAQAYKVLASSSAIAYLRAYQYFTDLTIGVGSRIETLNLYGPDYSHSVIQGIKNVGGTLRWYMRNYEAGVATEYNGATLVPTTNKWYCTEVLRDITNDIQKIWIDLTLEISQTDVQTENTERIYVGQYQSGGGAITTYIDCLILTDYYNGLEPPASGSVLTCLWKP